ncbi:MAG: hypothetical protein HGA44_13265 [Cellulomonadaceae bacterium]|nr:hypothetical protein [Cellulomonadaceae bacterium]
MSDAKEPGPYPQARVSDHVRTGLDAAVAAIPVVGGSATVLLNAVVAPSLQRRREAWFERMGDFVDRLTTDGRVSVSDLIDDEDFVDAVIHASSVAARTHRDEKLLSLQHALENVALGKASGLLRQRRLIQLVDDLEPEHLIVLKFLANPRDHMASLGIVPGPHDLGSTRSLFRRANLPVTGLELHIVLNDLSSHMLANAERLETSVTAEAMYGSRSLELGDLLLSLVSDPFAEDE